MSLILEDSAVSEENVETEYVELDIPGHIILLSDPADTEKIFVLPTTAINVQDFPIYPVTAEEKNKETPKNVPMRPLYTCETCNYTTSRLSFFEKHQLTHWVVRKSPKINEDPPIKNKEPIKVKKGTPQLQKSSKMIVNKTKIKKESVKFKSEDPEFKCPHCSYFTSNYRSLRIHMHIHSKGNAYRCFDCNFSGKNLAELISHHKRSKKLLCKYCTFKTHSKELFKDHKEKNHAAKWFGCMKCKFAAADRSYVAKHMAEKHSNALRFDPVQLEPESDVKD